MKLSQKTWRYFKKPIKIQLKSEKKYWNLWRFIQYTLSVFSFYEILNSLQMSFPFIPIEAIQLGIMFSLRCKFKWISCSYATILPSQSQYLGDAGLNLTPVCYQTSWTPYRNNMKATGISEILSHHRMTCQLLFPF